MPTQPNDLSFNHGKAVLNIRVVVLLLTPKGYLFERYKDEFSFPVGGRVKIHETTEEAAKRELKEELNLEVETLKLTGLIENFFLMNGREYHELNFVFRVDLKDSLDLGTLVSEGDNEGFIAIQQEDLEKYDIRPKAILQLIASPDTFCHLVNREI